MLIRVAESVLFIGIGIAAVVAAIVPLALSAGFGDWNRTKVDPDAIVQSIVALLTLHWMIVVYILLVVMVVVTIFVAIHGAIEAGSARIYLDGEAAVPASAVPAREQYAVFTMERFLDGVRAGWWETFWIYNLAWTVAAVIILLPVIATALVMLAVGANAGSLVLGCLMGVVMVFLIFIVALLASVWVQKAVLHVVGRGLPARRALSEARWQIGSDLGRHVGLALIMLVLAIGGAIVIGSMSAGLSLGQDSLTWQLLTSPLRLAASFLNTAYSAAVASWFMACLAAIQSETS